MHPIIRKIWERKLTLSRWAKANGFSSAYCSMVIHGKRGVRGFGQSEDIINALKACGFWVEPEKRSGGNKMNELILEGQANEGRMASIDILELTEKPHKHVMKDIRTLVEQEAINGLSFELLDYTNARGEKRSMYCLDVKATMALVIGYDAKRR